jgi:dienelactone hydrolase
MFNKIKNIIIKTARLIQAELADEGYVSVVVKKYNRQKTYNKTAFKTYYNKNKELEAKRKAEWYKNKSNNQ